MYQPVHVVGLMPLTWGATSILACALAAEPGPPSSDTDDEAVEEIEEIIITGTRLRVSGVEQSMPVTVLDRRDIMRSGADSIGKVLQALPAITGSQLNTNVNGSPRESGKGGGTGDGSVRAALRGGSVVLLNGRRFPNGGVGADSSVDFNMLPVSCIDRVEVLSGGASAVYGADAVGGVINVITRQDVGLDAALSRSITQQGDGEIITGQAAARLLDAHGGIWGIGVDYARQDGVTLDRRGYSAMPQWIVDEAGTLEYAGDIATPDGRFTVPAGNTLGLQPGYYTRVAGTTGQASADYRPYDTVVDAFNQAPFAYSQTPSRRTGVWLVGSRPFGERARFFVEGLAHERTSEQKVSSEGLHAWHFLPELEDGVYGIPADNYYNPFGVPLPGLEEDGPATRRFVEAGDRAVSEDIDFWRVLIGLEASVGAWTWEASVAESRSDALTVERGFFLRGRFADALGPSGLSETGDIVCGQPDPETGVVPAESIVLDCVPLNLFGGAGSITQEQIDFMNPRPLTYTGTNEQRIADLLLRGPFWRMGDRELIWVLGASFRHELGRFRNDLSTEEAINHLVGRGLVPDAHYDAKELFAEVMLPILSDRPWARDVTINFGARWSDFSYFGQNSSWQAGLQWRFAEEVMMRASYAEVFRTPTLDELYGPREDSVEFAYDPCGNDPSPEQRVNCASNGVPGGAYAQVAPGVLVIRGGNPNLEPETGHTVGAGLVYTPGWAKGVSASIDYTRAFVDGFIGAMSVDDLLYGCAEYGFPRVCDGIRRLPNGRVSLALTMNRNLGWSETSAFDIAVNWQATAGSGDLALRLLATYLERSDEQPVPGWPVAHHAGTNDAGAMPRWRAQGSVDWYSGAWTSSYSTEYIGSYSEQIDFEPYRRQVEPILYHDLEAGFKLENGVSVRAAISNVLDEDPPFVNGGSLANTDSATYRLLGRTYFLELRFVLR